MVNTRKTEVNSSPSSSYDKLTAKIEKSKLNTESKEIFLIMMTLFTTIQTEKEERIRQLEDSLKQVKQQLSSYESKFTKEIETVKKQQDDSDQYERRDTLIISGPNLPTFEMGENLKNTIQKMFSDHLSLPTQQTDFSTAHRLGPKPNSGADRRPIILKLCRRDQVSEIFKACKRYKPPFFVNMSLTPYRNKIMYTIRQLKRSYPNKIDGVRNTEGKIQIFLKKPSNLRTTENFNFRRLVNTRHELESILQEMDIPLNSISATW